MNLKLLTPAQKKVYSAIATHFVETGSVPSFQAIGDRLGGRSLCAVFKHVHNLEKLGMVKLKNGRIQNLKMHTCPTCGHRKTA